MVVDAKAPFRSRTQQLGDHVSKMASGAEVYVLQAHELFIQRLIDRTKIHAFLLAVGKFIELGGEKAGRDPCHQMYAMFQEFLSQLPPEEGDDNFSIRRWPPLPLWSKLNELSCYMVGQGGKGPESIFCSEAMNQLFISTGEMLSASEDTGLTMVTLWASFMTAPSVIAIMKALARTMLRKRKEVNQEDVEVECVTRTGLTLPCIATLGWDLDTDGTTSIVLHLSANKTQQHAGDGNNDNYNGNSNGITAAAPANGAQQLLQEAGIGPSSSSSPESHFSRESSRRTTRSRVPKDHSGRNMGSQQYGQEDVESKSRISRRKAKKRRHHNYDVPWSEDGAPLPEDVVNRLLSKAPRLATMKGGNWCREEGGMIMWKKEKRKAGITTVMEQQQQQQQVPLKQQQEVPYMAMSYDEGGGEGGLPSLPPAVATAEILMVLRPPILPSPEGDGESSVTSGGSTSSRMVSRNGSELDDDDDLWEWAESLLEARGEEGMVLDGWIEEGGGGVGGPACADSLDLQMGNVFLGDMDQDVT